jgi:ELWxxDGT repeat protein
MNKKKVTAILSEIQQKMSFKRKLSKKNKATLWADSRMMSQMQNGGISMKFKSVMSIFFFLTPLMMLTQSCSGGGGGSGTAGGITPPAPITVTHLFYTDCVNTACSTTTLYEYAPETNTHTRVDPNGVAPGGYYEINRSSLGFNGKLYYNGSDGVRPSELFVYDPLAPKELGVNPKAVYQGSSGVAVANPYGFFTFANKLYFTSSIASDNGAELFIYDDSQPASATNPLFVNINPGVNNGSGPGGYTVYNNKIYFYAYTDASGRELWELDPSLAIDVGTNPKQIEIQAGSSSSSVDSLTVHNGKLYFACDDGVNGRELCVYDATQAISSTNPKHLADINAGTNDSYPYDLKSVGGKLVFVAEGATTGYELYVFDDGSAISSTNPQIVEIRPGAGSGNSFGGIAVIGTKYYFKGNDGVNGREPWVFDVSKPVSSTNPKMLSMITGGTGSQPDYITSCLVDSVCFSVFDPSYSTAGAVYLYILSDDSQALSFADPKSFLSIGIDGGDPSAFTTMSWTVTP